MAKPIHIQEIAYGATVTTPGDKLQSYFDRAKSAAGRKLWRGWLSVAASGFGKGMIATALVIITATSLAFGFGAGEHMLTLFPDSAISSVATVEQGLTVG